MIKNRKEKKDEKRKKNVSVAISTFWWIFKTPHTSLFIHIDEYHSFHSAAAAAAEVIVFVYVLKWKMQTQKALNNGTPLKREFYHKQWSPKSENEIKKNEEEEEEANNINKEKTYKTINKYEFRCNRINLEWIFFHHTSFYWADFMKMSQPWMIVCLPCHAML